MEYSAIAIPLKNLIPQKYKCVYKFPRKQVHFLALSTTHTPLPPVVNDVASSSSRSGEILTTLSLSISYIPPPLQPPQRLDIAAGLQGTKPALPSPSSFALPLEKNGTHAKKRLRQLERKHHPYNPAVEPLSPQRNSHLRSPPPPPPHSTAQPVSAASKSSTRTAASPAGTVATGTTSARPSPTTPASSPTTAACTSGCGHGPPASTPPTTSPTAPAAYVGN